MRRIVRRLLRLITRRRHEAELREEIETHRLLRQAALERQGVPEAATRSRRAIGNVTLAVEDSRGVWGRPSLEGALQDAEIVLRGLRRSPVFTMVAVSTLALGIGANTALFSIFNSLTLRPLPVRDPASLAYLSHGSRTYPIWQAVERLGADVFDGSFAWANESFDLSEGGEIDTVDGALVSGRMFDVLGVTAARGRALNAADDRVGSDAVAVISHRLWQRQFAGSPEVIGARLTLQRVPFTIVGVLPPGFTGVDVGRVADVMIPFGAEPLIRGSESFLEERSTWWLDIMVRRRQGQTIDQANAALRGLQPEIRALTLAPDWPADRAATYLAEPLALVPAATGRSPLRGRFETPLRVMIGAVGLVLLIACANLANLLLARAINRRRELSVRLALGASRWRIARMLLFESLALSLIGAALGLLFARWSSGLLVRQLSTWNDAVSLDLGLDTPVLVFSAVLACLTAVTAGIAPAFGMKRVGAGEALRDSGRSIAGDRRWRLRGSLVVVQVALSLMLLVAAGLFLQTLTSLTRVPLGFTPENLVVMQVNLQSSPTPADQRGALVDRVREAVARTPGVRSVAASFITPITNAGWNNGVGEMTVPDRSRMTWVNAITPQWFDTMGINLRSGRDFDAADRVGAPRVTIVNEAFVARFLPGPRPALGQTVRVGGPSGGVDYEIVGVVSNAVYRSTREGMVPTMYRAFAQQGEVWPSVALTMAVDPERRASLERDVALALQSVDPSLAYSFGTFGQFIAGAAAEERIVALVSAFFGGLGLVLAAIGLYGVVSHAVSARRSEIGVRMALGATPARVVALVFRHVGIMLGLGLVLGLAGSYWAAEFVRALLFQLEPRDLATFSTAAVVLSAVVFTAAWVPARRAARLDPARVLREG